MDDTLFTDVRTQHLAGIIPVAAPPKDFNMPWHDALMPVGINYLAVERALYECAMVGCTTAWIVCHMSMQPLIRKIIGDSLFITNIRLYQNVSEVDKKMNIFYVPIHPTDLNRRDCLAWSVLHGANVAFRTCRYISKWVVPSRYYCAFPYGVAPDDFFKQHRKTIRSKRVLFSHNGKTIKDGIHASFNFDAKDYWKCRDIVKSYAVETWQPEINMEKSKKKALFLELDYVFKGLDTTDATVIEYPWFYEIDSWDKYCNFLGSGLKLQKDTIAFCPKERRKAIQEQ